MHSGSKGAGFWAALDDQYKEKQEQSGNAVNNWKAWV